MSETPEHPERPQEEARAEAPPPPPRTPPPRLPPGPPRKRGGVWAVVATILLLLSLITNGVLLLGILVMAIGASGGAPGPGKLIERTVEDGPAGVKIVVIRIAGVIGDEMVAYVDPRLRRAAEDNAVKAVILRIDSPGGGLTASDQIHHLVASRLDAKPVVAAMDSVAASGGYYVACAADEILAQPTTITGSIGVIGQFFFLRNLMADKLGVVPVTLKMGEQKDWPNIFEQTQMTPAQRDYLMESLFEPGYERFVSVVAAGRGMTEGEVRPLATGRIFIAPEALDAGLIDEVAYFETAVQRAMDLAAVQEARVVEYETPFGLGDLFRITAKAERALDTDAEDLAALATPRAMYLWTGQ